MSFEIRGLKEVEANLNREIRGIKNRSRKGLINAAITVRRDMDRTEPLVPIGRTGNLHASWFTAPLRTLRGPALQIGFEANYAAAVHEMVDRGRHIDWSRPGSGPKYLEKALDRNKLEMLKDIQREARVR